MPERTQREITIHPVNNGIVDQNVDLLPHSKASIISVETVGTTITSGNVQDALSEVATKYGIAIEVENTTLKIKKITRN